MYISLMVDVNLGEVSDDNLIEELEDRGFTVEYPGSEEDVSVPDNIELEAQKLWAMIRNGNSWEDAARNFIFTLANKVV